MLNRRQFLIILSILLLPWINLVYSFYGDNLTISEYIPTNKCVEIAKIKFNNSVKTINSQNSIESYDLFNESTNLTFINNNTLEIESNIVERKLKKKPLKSILVVGDSLGEGLYLAYYKRLKKKLNCFKVKFFVKHSTTTKSWIRNKSFLKELSSKKYDVILVVLGANEFATDKTILYYNINKFLIKLRKINPDIQVFWVVPSVPNRYLRKYVEECIGKEYTIALEDYLEDIPLSKDKIHPDIRKRGYMKLWQIVLNRLTDYREINCLK